MHKNTLLVVSVLAVVAALVVGVNLGKKIGNKEEVAPTPTPFLTVTPTPILETFTNTPCGFTIRYPNTLTLLDSGSGSAILRSATKQSDSIVMTCQEDIPRPALIEENIENFTLPTSKGSSVSAKLYHSQSEKDGTPIDSLIFTHPTKLTDVFVAGYGKVFDDILQTLTLIP